MDFFVLSEAKRDHIRTKNGYHNQLMYAILLKYFESEGQFSDGSVKFSPYTHEMLANQLDIPLEKLKWPTEHAANISRIIPDWCPGMVDPAGAGENMHTKEKTINFLQTRSSLRLVKASKANHAKEAMIDEIYERVRDDHFKIFSTIKGRGGAVTR